MSTKTPSSFPRFSLTGKIILAVYLSSVKVAFDASHHGASFRSGQFATSSSTVLNSVIVATSFLNVVSHAAVVLGALHDTFVLSILVGVGFDVVSQVTHTVWWVQLSATAFGEMHEREAWSDGADDGHVGTLSFLAVLGTVYGYQIVVHVRALQMNESCSRLVQVLHSGLNNLRGVAGKGYEDHIFAYSDLGGHLAPLHVSFYLLKQQEALTHGAWTLGLLSLASGLILSQVPLHSTKRQGTDEPFIKLKSGNTIVCSCETCKRRFQSTGMPSSFTFTRRDGVCRLWLYSFEELSNVLRDVSDISLSKKKR